MEFGTIKFEEPENGIGLITLNRPDKLNAINLEMLEDFQTLFRDLTNRPEVRVVILRGEGRGFCSGADLMDQRMLQESPELYKDAATFLEGVQKKYSQLIVNMRLLPQPIIAVVQGRGRRIQHGPGRRRDYCRPQGQVYSVVHQYRTQWRRTGHHLLFATSGWTGSGSGNPDDRAQGGRG